MKTAAQQQAEAEAMHPLLRKIAIAETAADMAERAIPPRPAEAENNRALIVRLRDEYTRAMLDEFANRHVSF